MSKICLVGNQNSGKTTLFNELTGMNQKIGNWPGVTIEKKTGIIKQTNYELVDLPGIYSLNPYTEEEKVSINYILQEKPDIIINIIDATCLERSLYLTTELLELNSKVIVALNMVDMLEKKGINIDVQVLEKELNVKVCKISALKKEGINELIENIKQTHNTHNFLDCKNCIEKNCKINNYEQMATKRYEYISKIVNKCLYKKRRWMATTTEMLDKIILNKILGIPIFIIIMFGIYFLSVGVVGKNTSNTTAIIMDKFSKITKNILETNSLIDIPKWLQSLITDGALKGMTSVLSFIPQLVILFTCISILETTGYLSRVAFLLDSILKKVGLSGKSLIPFIIGSGCSVPGIMSTKIIENEEQKKMTSILVPFIPCSAKLPIIALFSGYFFKENAGIMSASLYFLSIIVIIISSIILKKYIFKDIESSFVSELPEYKLPNIKYVIRDVYEKTLAFIKRAGSTILISSIIVWFLISFSTRLEYGIDMEKSILASIGKKISWIFVPMIGINSWELTVSAMQGIIAKEQVISSMSIISGTSNQNIFIQGGNFDFLTQWSAYAYVVFNLYSAPCIATIAAMKKELGRN